MTCFINGRPSKRNSPYLLFKRLTTFHFSRIQQVTNLVIQMPEIYNSVQSSLSFINLLLTD